MKKAKNKPADAGIPGDPPLFQVLTEIDIISHLATNEFERLLPEGFTNAQFGVLNRLLRLNTEETIGELAAAFQVAQPTMSSTVKKLEQKQYVELYTSANDKRTKHVRITPQGKKVRNNAVKMIEPHQTQFISTAPDIDWATILPALTTLRDFLDKRR